jgi:TPR repeat protein
MHKSLVHPGRRAKATTQQTRNTSTKSLLTSKKPHKARRPGFSASKSFATTSKPAASTTSEPVASPKAPNSLKTPSPNGLDAGQQELHSELNALATQFATFQQSQVAFQQQVQHQFQQFQQQLTIIATKMDDKTPQDITFGTKVPKSTPALPSSLPQPNAAAKEWYDAQNFQTLLDWSQKAVANNDADGGDSAYYLGLLFSQGRVVVPGNIPGQPTLPLTLKEGEPDLPDHHRAFRLWTIAADQDHLDSQHRLGWLHFNGDLLSSKQVNPSNSLNWTGPGGNLISHNYFGEWGPDVPTAIKLWTKAAQRGHVDSQHALGLCYSNKSVGVPDYKAAAKFHIIAAASGHIGSQAALGALYSSDKLGAPDYTAAAEWCTKAAEHGHLGAQSILGKLHHNGHLGSVDFESAHKWLAKAAEQGYAAAQLNLGMLYGDKKWASCDRDTALEWYTKAVEHGDPDLQFKLGEIYSAGDFIGTDDDAAHEWYTEAAKQGHADAQFHLGKSQFHLGNSNLALEWYTKASKQGHALASSALGHLYESTFLRRPNFHTARMCYTKAIEQGDPDAPGHLARLERDRDDQFMMMMNSSKSDEEVRETGGRLDAVGNLPKSRHECMSIMW